MNYSKVQKQKYTTSIFVIKKNKIENIKENERLKKIMDDELLYLLCVCTHTHTYLKYKDERELKKKNFTVCEYYSSE